VWQTMQSPLVVVRPKAKEFEGKGERNWPKPA